LYTGQCNCAYWHGVFGGLYLSHLRRAVYTHLIAAEELLERAHSSRTCVTRLDADADGREEAALKSPAMSVLVDPGEGGAITEWCLYESRLNLLDTLTRRPEPYHEKLKAHGRQLASSVPGARAPQSIHDVLGVKEAHLDQYLVYDDHRRSAFLDYGLEARPTIQELVRASWTEHQLWSGGRFRWEANAAGRRADGASVAMVRDLRREGGRIRKTVRVAPGRAVLECRYALEGVRAPVIALEFNLSLRDERYLAEPGEQEQVSRFTLAEPGCGVSLTLDLEPAATVMCFPIETVSESEEGLERTYQGLCLVCLWVLPQAAGGSDQWAATVRWTVD
jgi:alpha-amylase